MRKVILLTLGILGINSANAQDVKITLTVPQVQYLAHALDITVKTEGIQSAEVAVPILDKLRAAKPEEVKNDAKSKGH